jgi:NitT/TauT family transport system permease protein
MRKLPERMVTAVWRLVLIAVVGSSWEGVTALGWVRPFWVSSPSAIFLEIYEMFASGEVFLHAGVTLYETVLGFATGALGGILAGFALAYWERANRVLDPFIGALNSLPRVALAPLFILWFGIGMTSKVVLGFSLVVFILLINTYAGAKNVDRDLVIITRLLGGSDRLIMVKVVLPASIPWIFAGLRLGLAYALVGAVVGEVIVAQAGLGFLISRAAGVFNTAGVFAVLIVLMAISMLLNEAMLRAERKLLHWRPQQLGSI